MHRHIALLLAGLTVLPLTWGPVSAAEAEPLVVTYNKARILHLAKPASRVVVGNPGIADVSMESPTLMYVFGRAPGETSLSVLGNNGQAILSRPVVVTTEGKRTVSVHVPAADGPVDRAYSCLADRCLRVPSPDTVAAGNVPAASPVSGAAALPPLPVEGGAAGAASGGAPTAGPIPPIH
jgi:hypothetical protein